MTETYSWSTKKIALHQLLVSHQALKAQVAAITAAMEPNDAPSWKMIEALNVQINLLRLQMQEVSNAPHLMPTRRDKLKWWLYRWSVKRRFPDVEIQK